ncbi:DEAD-box ATP-dependent RNA helicase 40 [Acorus calamus]|uniref:DEAD-box ATP-dependent RNA helicase 40 n=1 Tax=Acorus calamus TaxID=4465 RepID=A0AAV9D1K7_ACOCL|nr:DEAD-box ATP-dependent RNA helicase 40 [Acorus calamus]
MSTLEAAAAFSGPRYAPEDPTLPPPWKGLIDGSTGTLYYWNPETNVTQYEKPTFLPLPLPPGPPPTSAAASPNLAQIPVSGTLQPNGAISQSTQSTVPQIGQHAQHQALQVAQQQGPQQQAQQPTQQQESQQALQHSAHQLAQPIGQQIGQQHQVQQNQLQYQGQQIAQQQSAQQITQQQLGQQMQPNQYMPYQQGQMFQHPQLQHMPHQQYSYQQILRPPAQQIPQSQTHGQQIPQQQFKFQQGEEIDRQPGGNQIGYPSSSQVQQSGVPSIHNVPGGRPPVQTPQMGVHPIQQQQTGGASYDIHQNSGSSVQLHQTGADAFHRQQTGGSTFATQTGQVMVHSQHSSGSPIGLKTGLGGDQYRRAGNEFYSNSNKDGADMMPTHPKLAAIPLPLNQQDKRISAIQPPNNAAGRSGGLNIVSGPTMPSMYNHAVAGQPFPNAMPMRPPLRFPDPSNISNMSAVEIYRQEHEVSAMGKDVPAPFITFEATGFPPEILREVILIGFSFIKVGKLVRPHLSLYRVRILFFFLGSTFIISHKDLNLFALSQVRYLLQIGAYVVRCSAIHCDYTATVLGAAII